jgi:choline/glycine/proline betaine transport protein
VLLIAGITAVAVVSVVSGIHAGIRTLSMGNILLFTLLLAFVFVAGPTLYLVNTLLSNIGYYLQHLPETALQTAGLADSAWLDDWSLFYWGWWVSWSPFVGMFIARISRGRTIREFIAGVLLVPVLVSFFIFTVFGNTGIYFELMGEGNIVEATTESFEFSFFAMLDLLPMPMVTSVLAIIVVTIFFITSSDSGSLVDDIHASGGNIQPSRATRIYWGVAEGMVAATLLIASGEAGLSAFQLAALATGFPLTLLLLGMCYALVLSLQRDCAIQEMNEQDRLREETRREIVRELHQSSWPVNSPFRYRTRPTIER